MTTIPRIPLSYYLCHAPRCRRRFTNDLNVLHPLLNAPSGMVHCPYCGHNYSTWVNAAIVLAFIHAHDPDYAAYR